MGHSCASTRKYSALCKEYGITKNSAAFPLRLAKFFIEYLTAKGDLVADVCGGSQTTAVAASMLERRFITSEIMGEFIYGGGLRFGEDVSFNPNFLAEIAK